MAIAFVSSARQTGSTVSSFTMTVDVGTGSNRLLVVFLMTRSATLYNVSSMTYNSVAMSQAALSDNTVPANKLRSEVWYLANPSSGSNTLSVTWSSAPSQYECQAAWFTGVDQTSPLDDTDAASGDSNTPAVSLTPTVDNCLLAGGVIHEAAAALGSGSGETTIYNNDNGAWVTSSEYAIQTTAATQSVDWTGGSDYWAAAGAVFKEYVASGGVTVTPAAVYSVSATVNPTTILGSVSITPAQVGSVSTVVAPGVIQGAITIANKIAAAVSSIVNPTTVLGSLSITPDPAGGVSSTVAPNVIQGAISIANKIAEAIGAVVNPTVSAGGGTLITPDPASGIANVGAPGVIQGSLVILNKIASAIGLTVNPTVVHGSMTVAPDPAGSVSGSVAPTVNITDPGTPGTRKRFLDFPWWIR